MNRICSEPETKPKPKRRRKNRRLLFRQMKDRRATRRMVSNKKSVRASNPCNCTEDFKSFTECQTSLSFAEYSFMEAFLQNSKVTTTKISLYSRDKKMSCSYCYMYKVFDRPFPTACNITSFLLQIITEMAST